MKILKSFVAVLIITIAALIGIKVYHGKTQVVNLEQLQPPEPGEEIAIIQTNYGDIKIRLFPEIAPKAVENFKTLAKKRYYDGQIFYRVKTGNFIQAGDPTGAGKPGESIWGAPFEDEFNTNYRNFRGALSMANQGADTNESNFFIVQSKETDQDVLKAMEELKDKRDIYPEDVVKAYKKFGGLPDLDFKHTVFGEVFDGMKTVDSIAKVSVDMNYKPVEPVTITAVKIIKYQK